MSETETIEEQRKALEREGEDLIQSREALQRLRAAYSSPVDRQRSQSSNNDVSHEEAQPS